MLAQLGLLPEYLPIPYVLPGAQNNDGKRLEYRLPITGIETAQKLRNKDAVMSNVMLGFQARTENV